MTKPKLKIWLLIKRGNASACAWTNDRGDLIVTGKALRLIAARMALAGDPERKKRRAA